MNLWLCISTSVPVTGRQKKRKCNLCSISEGKELMKSSFLLVLLPNFEPVGLLQSWQNEKPHTPAPASFMKTNEQTEKRHFKSIMKKKACIVKNKTFAGCHRIHESLKRINSKSRVLILLLFNTASFLYIGLERVFASWSVKPSEYVRM